MPSVFDAAKNILADGNKIAQDNVDTAMAKLKEAPDDPIALAEFQHAMNKYSHVFSLSSTIMRIYKDLLQTIVQKY